MRMQSWFLLAAVGLLLSPAAWATEPEKDWSGGQGRLREHRERYSAERSVERATRERVRSDDQRPRARNAERPGPAVRDKPAIRPDLMAKGAVKGPNAESSPGARSQKAMLNPAMGAKPLFKAPESDHGGGTRTSLSDKARINPAMLAKSGFKAPEGDSGGGAKTSLSMKAKINPAMLAKPGFKGSAAAANGPDGPAAAKVGQAGRAKMSPVAAKVSAPTEPTIHSAPAARSPGHEAAARAKAAQSTISAARAGRTASGDER